MTVIHIKETTELVAEDKLLSGCELEVLQMAGHESEVLLATDFPEETREGAVAALHALERRGLLTLGLEGWAATEAAEERLLQHDDIIRAKWSMDGAATLEEAAGKLREYADHLVVMAQEGWVLNDPIDDDYGFLHRSKETLAAALGEQSE